MFPNSTDVMLDNKSDISSGTKSYIFDFTTCDFVVRDGKLIECDGIDAIKVWICFKKEEILLNALLRTSTV